MSSKKHRENLENIQKEIEDSVKRLLSSKPEKLLEEDKSFYQFLVYAFSPQKANAKLAKDKSYLKLIKAYIKVLDIIFQFELNGRKELYSTKYYIIKDPSLSPGLKDSLIPALKDLDFLLKKIKNEKNDFIKEREEVFIYLENLLSKQNQTLFFVLDYYQIYFSNIVLEPDILRFIFFKVYRNKYISFFKYIDLDHYKSNLKNKICLDLVLIFFKSLQLKAKNEIVLLSIIFNFDLLFHENNQLKIDKLILEKAIDKTYEQIENSLIDKNNLNLINYNFLANLKNTLDLNKKKYADGQIINNECEKKSYSSDSTNEKTFEENKKNENKINDNEVGKQDIIHNNNEVDKHIKDNTTINMKLNELNNNNNDNQKVKIEANNLKELQEQLNQIINELKNENSIIKKEYSIIINENSLIKNENSLIKNEYSILKNENSIIKNQLENEKKERIEQNIEITNKIESMEIEIDSLKTELNIIQIRDKIKNILNSFHYLLSPNDLDDIEKKFRKRSEVFSGAFERKFWKYKEKKKYAMIKELLIKSANLLDSGNNFAHTLYNKNYKEKINEFLKKNDIKVCIPPDKILFLCLCDLPNEYLDDSIDFIMDNFDKDFSSIISRSEDIFEKYLKS